MRVMHINRGLPFTSALQEPHFPALQFQRTAKSLACCAWIAWMTSSTTMPSPACNAIILELAAGRIAAPHSHVNFFVASNFSSTNALRSAGIS